MNDIHDSEMFDLLEQGFSGAGYARPASSFPSPSIAPRMIGAGAIAITALAATFVYTGRGGHGEAYGWTPTAIEPTAADRAKALAKCDTNVDVIKRDGLITVEFSRNTSGVPNMTLDTLDMRGDIAIATLHAEGYARLCTLDVSNDDWVEGPSTGSAGGELWGDPGPSELQSPIAQTGLLQGRTVISGFAPAETVGVSIDVEGLPTAVVEVHGGMYSTWLPEVITGGTATAYDANGAIIGTVPIEM